MKNPSPSPLFCWTVLYPNTEGATFDFDYYTQKLIPEYVAILGDNCVQFEVRKGLATPGASAPNFVCIASFWLTSGEAFRASMADERMKVVMERIFAFTDIKSIRQFDQIVA